MVYLVIYSALCTVYIAFQAKNITDYSDASFATSVTYATVGVFAMNLWKMPDIFALIDNLEEMIENRKSLWI